jgi:hypothetical protein
VASISFAIPKTADDFCTTYGNEVSRKFVKKQKALDIGRMHFETWFEHEVLMDMDPRPRPKFFNLYSTLLEILDRQRPF